MPNVTKLLERTKKKLDLNEFFGEEAWITIKKLKPTVLRKIQFMSIDTFSSKIGKEMIKKMRENQDFLNADGVINEDAAMDLLSEMDLDSEKSELLQNASNNIEKIVLENGVDPNEHNLTDEKEEKITLDYDLFMAIGNEKLLKYIVDSIRNFSQGFSLGEQIKPELNTP